MIIFRLTTETGYQENRDAEVLKDYRTASQKSPQEWPITALETIFVITNDPQLRQFETYDEMEAARDILQQETFQGDHFKVLLEPQPDSLND